MRQSTKLFEKKFIRLRNAIERKGITMAKRALSEQYKSFLEKTKSTDFRQWPELAENISQEPIERFMKQYYPMSAKLAVMTRKNMIGQKSEEEDVIYESIFQNKLTSIVNTVAGEKITTITATSKDRILSIIRGVLDEADTEGWGIDKITSNLFQSVGRDLRGNGYARARAIAQTEMISASNQASTMAAESTGLNYRKFWSTSGLPNIRISHIEAEEYSNAKDGLLPDETFPNGLLYPGDPNGTSEEVINCRCTIMHEIII